MSERQLNTALRTSLLNGDEFININLVKFEKPKTSLSGGGVSEKATDYAYFTDAPYPIDWDDGSFDSEGNANGTQTYIPNKLLNVGTIKESIEARATTMSLKLSTIALGTVVSDVPTITATYIDTDLNLAKEGFKPGDKVLLTSSGTNNDVYVRFDRFTSEGSSDLPNSRVYYSELDDTINTDSGNSYIFTLSSEEIKALTQSKSSTLYSNYINREVFIYRAHATPADGTFIGAPFLLFKGIISQGSIKESTTSEASITWGLTSHWGDFIRVQGRLTSDAAHRALGSTGKPDSTAIIRPEYAADYGFMHAEKSVNVLATYQAEELRYKMKRRGGLAGLFGGKKVVEYYETVDRDVDLRFDLSAKYLPVVYGVQKVSNIPVFADIDVSDPSEFYAVFALCEGEIGGVYDIHIEGEPSVCVDKSDFDARERDSILDAEGGFKEGVNANTVCYGRADRGQVLSGGEYRGSTPVGIAAFDIDQFGYQREMMRYGGVFGLGLVEKLIGPSYNASAGQGLTHETTFSFEIPIDASFIVHTGLPDQDSDEVLVDLASSKSFKIQSNYFEGDPSTYWSTSHRLLDTAYVTGHFTLSEGEETIPDYEFVVKGKFVNCYNYDHSFKIYSGNPDNYDLGDTVDLYVDDVLTHSNVQIIDKWTMYDKEGNEDVRFRWRTNWPNSGDTLVDLDGGTKVTMAGAGNVIMRTYDYVTATGTLSNSPTDTLSAVNYTQLTGGTATLTVDFTGSGLNAVLSAAGNENAYIASQNDPRYSFLVESFSAGTATLAAYSGAQSVLENLLANGDTIFVSNLLNGASGVEVGDEVTVSRVVGGSIDSRVKTIRAVSGSYAFTESPFYTDFYAQSGDTFTTYWKYKDQRVTINPAMQLLDYITSKRYGKGLDIDKDLNLSTWLESGRLCDDRSKVVVVSSSAPTVGDVYRINRGDGSLIFQGTVSAVTTRTYSGTKYEIEFDDVIGKLGYKWNNWRSFTAGDIVWYDGTVKTATSGIIANLTAFQALSGATVTLSKVSGTGPASLSILTSDLGGEKGTNCIVRAWSAADQAFSAPGYSLHDCDDVTYWKYIGWDEPEQRYVTRHQLNQVINTNTPLFDNINSMLNQFNGILRYANGKYELDVKTAAPPVSVMVTGVERISEADIIGDIKIDDKGQKSSFNSISASIVDPQNRFSGRSVSFFNSDFLKEDKGVPKQGTYALPGITNYYTARTNIIQFLKESRYGLKITFTMDPKGYLLLAGNIMAISYSRFEWEDKYFRIGEIGINPDGTVNIAAEEHNDDAYLIDYQDRDLSYSIGGDTQHDILPPTNLVASRDYRGEIELTWTNSAKYSYVTHKVEIWAAEATKGSDGEYLFEQDSAGDPILDSAGNKQYYGNDFTNATILDQTIGDKYVHDGLGTENVHVWFYWIRYVVPSLYERRPPKYSVFEPLSSGEGVEGIATSGALSPITLIVTNQNHTFPANEVGFVSNYTGSGTLIKLLENDVFLDYVDVPPTAGVAPGQWTFANIDAIDINTPDPIESTDGTYAIVPDQSGMADDVATITYQIEGRRAGGENIIGLEAQQSFSVAKSGADGDQGADGLDQKAVKLTSTAYLIAYDENEINPNPAGPLTLTATAQNLTDPWFRFTGDGLVDEGVFTDGNSDNVTATRSWSVPANFFLAPQTIQVEVSEGDQVPLAYDTITIAAVHPGTDGSAGVSARNVIIRAETQAVYYDVEGDLIEPSTILISATAYNTTGTPYFTFYIDDVQVPDSSVTVDTTGNEASFIYNSQVTEAGMPDKIEVELSEGGAGTGFPVLARDQLGIYDLQYGTDALTVIMSNPAHTVFAETDGSNPDMTGSGTTIKVYEGAAIIYYEEASLTTAGDDVDGPRKWDFKTITAVNITESAPLESTDGEFAIIPDHTDMDAADNLGTVTYEIVGQRIDGRTFFVEVQQSIAKSKGGGVGESARGVKLTTTDLSFVYDEDGTNPTADGENTDGTLTITATPYNSTDPNIYYEFFVNGVSQGITDANSDDTGTFYYTPQSSYYQMPDVIGVKLREDSSTAAVLAEDAITMIGILRGSNSVVITLDNDSHVLPATDAGSVTDYTGSGTDIRVFEGEVELTFDEVGTSAGTYKVTASNPDIYVGGVITDDGFTVTTAGYCLVNDHSNFTADNTTIEYLVEGTKLDGTTTFSFTKRQSLSKSKAGVDGAAGAQGAAGDDSRAVNLTAPSYAYTYPDDGTAPTATGQNTDGTLTITASPVNFTDTPYYEFYKDDVSVQGPNTTNTYTYTPRTSIADMPDAIEVEVREGGAGNPILARDQINILGLNEGGSGISISLSNDSHTIPTDDTGTIQVETGSGTDINVWLGAAPVPYDGTPTYAIPSFRVTNVNDVNITAGSGSTVATYTRRYADVANDSMTADTAYIEFTIVVVLLDGTEQTFTRRQTFSKSIAGADGPQGDAGANGADGVYTFLTNSAHVVPADSDGSNPDFTGAGTEVWMILGNSPLNFVTGTPTNGQWTIFSATPTNITFSNTPTDSGNYATYTDSDYTGMSQDYGYIDFEVYGYGSDGTRYPSTGYYDLRQSFSKSKKGDFGTDGKTVSILPSTNMIRWEDGVPEVVTVTLDTQQSGFTIPYYWFEYNKNGAGWTTIGTVSTTSTRNLPAAGEPGEGQRTEVRVRVKEDVGGTYDAQDTETVWAVTDGLSAVTAIIQPAGVVIPMDADNTTPSHMDTAGNDYVILQSNDTDGLVCKWSVTDLNNATPDQTANATYSFTGGASGTDSVYGANYAYKTKASGLRCCVYTSGSVKGTVFFRTSSGSWSTSTDQETFSLTATYGGDIYTVEISATKASPGAQGSSGSAGEEEIHWTGCYVFAGDTSSPYSAQAGVKFQSDRDTEIIKAPSPSSFITDWCGASYTPSNYSILCTQVSGASLDYGNSLDVWYAGNSNPFWGLTRTTVGSESAIARIYIRRNSDGEIMGVGDAHFEIENGIA
jgi:hypothetical protein